MRTFGGAQKRSIGSIAAQGEAAANRAPLCPQFEAEGVLSTLPIATVVLKSIQTLPSFRPQRLARLAARMTPLTRIGVHGYRHGRRCAIGRWSPCAYSN